MKNRFSVFAIVYVMIAFAACKKPVSELAFYVPKDASAVFVVDPKAILDKIASSGITIDSLANLFTQSGDKYAMRWNDIKNSGIDLNHPVYFFSKKTNSIQAGKTESYGLIAQVEDVKKVEAFLKKEKADGDILSGGKYKYLALGDDYIAGWTDKIFIISSVTGGTYAPGTYSTGEGTLSQLQLTQLFTQNESASITSFGEFRDMLAKPGDIHFYTNASANLGSAPMLSVTKANSLLEGSYTEGTINFEKGKIIATSETHNNKALSDILEKYPSKEINRNMITSYPDSISAFGIIAFNPKVLLDILQYLGFDAMANDYTSQMGFTTEDVFNAFSGDIAFILSPGKGRTSETAMPGYNISTKYDSEFLLNLHIGNKAAFDKVIAALVNKNILSKNGDQYQLGQAGGHGFVIETTGDNLFISSGDDLVKAYQNNNKSNLPADVEKEISNKSMALYIDLSALFKKKNEDSSIDIHLHDKYYTFTNTVQAAKATFKNFIITTDKNDGKTIKGNFELNFVNTGENSLSSFVKFIAFARNEDLKNKSNHSVNPPIQPVPDMDSISPKNKSSGD